MATNIHVSDRVWERLNQEKTRGESFDDVLRELLEMEEHNAEAP